MIKVHTFSTDGFFPWAEIFVLSFRRYHNDMPIFITTRNLSHDQILKLENLSNDIVVENDKLDVDKFLRETGISKINMSKYKKEVETNRSYKRSVIWKQFISVEDRYRRVVPDMISRLDEGDILLHFDVDMYIRGGLNELFSIVEDNDVSIRFRPETKRKRFRVLGNIISFKVSEGTKKFLRCWHKYIDDIPLIKKPANYGQASFYYAYLDMKNDLKWGSIPPKFSDHKLNRGSLIWTGNDKYIGKTKILSKCYEDYNRKIK